MMHIIHIVRDLDIASGGPSRSVPALARSQARLDGVKVSLFYQNRGNPVVPLGDDGVAYQPVTAAELLFAINFRRHLPEPAMLDKNCVFHLHGLWSPTLHWAARFATRHGLPYVISPRGMLAGWCLEHKSFKKNLGWWLYQKNDLQRAACLLATSEAEQRDVTALLPAQAVAVVPNDCDNRPADLPVTPRGAAGQEPRLALAMGRLHLVKGYAELIEAWAALRPAGWQLAIVGPDEGGYRARLEALLKAHRLEELVSLPGAVDDRQKWSWFDRCDLFVAPSKTENFGVAIAEALQSGKPVITTTGTPWQCLAEEKAGWWVMPTSEALARALQEATVLDDAERRAMGERGLNISRRFSPDAIAGQLFLLYQWMLNKGERPEFVRTLREKWIM